MNAFKLLSIYILLLALTVGLHAQVTIGSSIEPMPGALLELKESDVTTKGLGLPRVKLTNLTDIKVDIPSVVAGNELQHTGLLVYNVNNDACAPTPIKAGMHVWDGTAWQYLGDKEWSSEVKTFVDNRDGEIYLYRKFGDKGGTWMLDNMRATQFDTEANSTEILSLYDGSTNNPPIQTMYTYPNVSPTDWNSIPATWNKRQGYLYNWRAVIGRNPTLENQGQPDNNPPSGNEVEVIGINGPAFVGGYKYEQGICPNGWHVPSDREWNQLEEEMYNNAAIYSGYTAADVAEFNPTSWQPDWNYGTAAPGGGWRGSAGTKGHGLAMSSSCLVSGSSSTTEGISLSAEKGGFGGLFVGRARPSESDSFFYGEYSLYWTASSYDASNTWYRYFGNKAPSGIYKEQVYRNAANRDSLLGVRCKKNID